MSSRFVLRVCRDCLPCSAFLLLVRSGRNLRAPSRPPRAIFLALIFVLRETLLLALIFHRVRPLVVASLEPLSFLIQLSNNLLLRDASEHWDVLAAGVGGHDTVYERAGAQYRLGQTVRGAVFPRYQRYAH